MGKTFEREGSDMQKIQGYMRSAMEQYAMVQDGDKIAVGVSGGKDSVALLYCLAQMRRYYPKTFDVLGLTLDPGFEGQETDYSSIEAMCRELDVEYIVDRTNIGHVVFETREEKNPCSLCANLRRGRLHTLAKELGCNKIALGHHRDDAVNTFFMNLLDLGTVDCFKPVTYLSRKDLTMIRPLIFAPEQEIANAVARAGLPIVKSSCPIDHKTERANIDALVSDLEQQYPGLSQKILGALQKGNIADW